MVLLKRESWFSNSVMILQKCGAHAGQRQECEPLVSQPALKAPVGSDAGSTPVL